MRSDLAVLDAMNIDAGILRASGEECDPAISLSFL
jgi:hypothetical protein